MASLAGLFLIALLYIGWRVYQIIRFNDYVLLLMIFFLNLELLSLIFFYIVNAHEDYIKHISGSDKDPPIMTVGLILPINFLTIAIIINLRNW